MSRVRLVCWLTVLSLVVASSTICAAPQANPSTDPAAAWAALQKPEFNPAKSAQVSNFSFSRDRLKFMLSDGHLQFSQPIAGVVHGAAFRGHGKIELDPPNVIEAQQLRLHSGQDKLSLAFTEATFSFTDNFFEEIASKVQWSGGAGGDLAGLYQSRQDEREFQGAEILPRIVKGLFSSDRKRTAIFAADLKTEKGWLHGRYDALDPEEISLGKWADYGFGKRVDTWVSFPAGGRSSAEAYRDPLEKEDFAVRSYKINSTVTDGAELNSTTQVTITYQAAGERVLLFVLDNNLRVESVRDAKGNLLPFFQPRESKDRRAHGDYVAVAIPEPAKAADSQTLEFRYGGKRIVRKVGSGNYFCQSFGWYPTRPNSFATRADFEMIFRSPKKYQLVATGNKANQTQDGDWLITTWKNDVPLAVAGFAFGDYKVQTEKVGNYRRGNLRQQRARRRDAEHPVCV